MRDLHPILDRTRSACLCLVIGMGAFMVAFVMATEFIR